LNNSILPINLPDIVAEVSDAFLQYESALLANDVTVLNDFFLDAPFTVRFGLAEHSYGAAAIRAFRKQAAPVDPRRRLNNTIITTMGRDAASASTEFSIPGSELVGRQTQVWMRTASGWKIVAAHVSAVAL
jgi:hypothetical protein